MKEDINEKVLDAYEKTILGLGLEESDDKEESISEATEVEFNEVDLDVKDFVEDLFKGTTYKAEKQQYWDGIHGRIVGMYDQFGGHSIRANKKMLRKILKNKDVRWVDISAVGM